jgi:L-malate glycosyltransferase
MYGEKRLDFLLAACQLIREQVPDFEMIFIGSGTQASLVQEKAEATSWIHYLGPKFDHEKIPYFAAAKVFLMPGLVGLAVLDCFALEVPLVTTQIPEHSPEIEYLQPGFNGLIVEEADDPRAFAEAVAGLMKDEAWRQELVRGCRISKERYTMEEMVERFSEGVKQALI